MSILKIDFKVQGEGVKVKDEMEQDQGFRYSSSSLTGIQLLFRVPMGFSRVYFFWAWKYDRIWSIMNSFSLGQRIGDN